MLNLLQFCLNILSKLYIWRYKPVIIAVTGNVGKTSTKEAIGVVISKIKKVRVSGGNLNNETGVPLTILGDFDKEYYEKGGTPWFWFKVLFLSFLRLFTKQNFPEVLLLEYGADHPGDIKKLVKKYKPHISVVTAVGDVPVHVEYFSGPEGVAREKSELVKALESSDYAILNHDGTVVLEMKDQTKAQVKTFGFSQNSDINISNFKSEPSRPDLVARSGLDDFAPLGVSFDLNNVQVQINGSLGKSLALSSAAAACVGTVFGMNIEDIAKALSDFHGPKGRLKVLKGIKNSWIIDDTYNAAPASTRMALESLRQAQGKRKIAILGDMLELGGYSESSHREIGKLASEFVDVLITVGSRAKSMSENTQHFENSNLAKEKIKELIQEGDIILVKGSQGMRMERIVESIMAEPERKKELLVRQSSNWLRR